MTERGFELAEVWTMKERDELSRIDLGLRMNYWLVRDGIHPAVDYKAVWAHIDSLLERRLELTRGTQ